MSRSSRAIAAAMTSSPFRRLIPLTPDVARPIGRAFCSAKRIAWPLRDTSMMSSVPDEWRTSTSASPSRSLIAMIPSDFSCVLYSSKRLLDHPVAGREDEVLGLFELAGRDHRTNLLL